MKGKEHFHNSKCVFSYITEYSLVVMAFQLDDLLRDDKKDANLIPDLSKATCNSQEEFRRLLERCPEYKIRSEKVKKEDSKVRDKDFTWRATKRELRAIEKEYGYGDPVPPDMRGLNLAELQQVSIDWRMLTPIRPKLRQDEEMFSRLVDMGKLEIKTAAKERHNFTSPIRRSKNRAGIIESSVKMCGDCGEEFCYGESCGDILYDSCIRVTVAPQQSKIQVSADTAAIIAKMDKPKKKSKKAKLVRSKSKKKNKSGRKNDSKDITTENSPKEGKKFKRKCKKKTN
ncbi:uncharacterized protein LOC124298505 [Neodiprion virginianus]|uniref:uncharacterized protein LOC124176267 n=2 Tax=Neodiprion TaxID=270857 RepID=UPI001ED90FDD|nr:uncharacterized protein LOC124176267 [Neodiprion fabricii]XP_046469616.1 uncharacterized protein LOC124212957 [Neodiprion pinetum]XP_046606565.1 uncharacterized protein LOC124298505 [Neodiprion virginianus]